MPRLRNANACCRAVQQALDWLGPKFESDDAWAAHPQPLVAYHKVPYLLAVTGRVEEAQRALIWIKGNLLRPDGRFNAAPVREGKPVVSACAEDVAWVGLAAQLTGGFDIARGAVRSLAEQQGNATGGVYELDDEGRRSASAGVRTTASAGLAFLSSGLLEPARNAGRFLTRASRVQFDETRFHVRLDAQGKPVRKFPAAQASSHVVARARGRTQIGHLGVPAVFLAKLHLATGETAWLEAAMDYFAFAEQYDEEAQTGEYSAPLGWGAAVLYGITRRRLYYDASDRVAQAWIERQRMDGSWRARRGAAETGSAITRTTEMALYLTESLREAQ